VLVVEDDAMVRDFVAQQLQQLGYRTRLAGNGKEALATLDDGAIDLLLTDVILPGALTGKQIADAAQRRRPDLKVLFMSGYTENAIVHHGRLDPGVLLLSKPFRASDLAQMVRRAMADNRQGNATGRGGSAEKRLE
jgi:CheY-like chemotaxis protein